MPEGPLRSGLYLGDLPRIFLPFDLLGGGGYQSQTLGPYAARATNEALFMAFQVDDTWDATGLNFNVGAQAGNFDVGIYDAAGNRLTSKGTTTVPASGLAVGAFTAVRLTRGRYFAAFVTDNVATFTFSGIAPQTGGAVANARIFQERGLFQMAAALPLPVTATFAECAWQAAPLLALELA